MTVGELIDKLKEFNPDTKVLVYTGSPEDELNTINPELKSFEWDTSYWDGTDIHSLKKNTLVVIL